MGVRSRAPTSGTGPRSRLKTGEVLIIRCEPPTAARQAASGFQDLFRTGAGNRRAVMLSDRCPPVHDTDWSGDRGRVPSRNRRRVARGRCLGRREEQKMLRRGRGLSSPRQWWAVCGQAPPQQTLDWRDLPTSLPSSSRQQNAADTLRSPTRVNRDTIVVMAPAFNGGHARRPCRQQT
jgi:hypothetical protein